MQRKSFLGHLTALGAFGFLPAGAFKQYQKFYLLQCFVAGFRFYKGIELLHDMKEGDLLELVREPANQYDASAIALHWNQQKIGFIPATENQVLSRLLDAQAIELTAEITHLNKEVQYWENLSIAVHFLKELSSGAVTENMKYLTSLETPHYTSFKHKNNTITRITWKTNPGENETDWYAFFEKHSKNNSIYDLIHNSNLLTDYKYGEETGEYLLINKNRLRHSNMLQQLLQITEQTVDGLDNLFDEKGFFVLSTKQAEAFVPKIEALVNVTDKLGRHFIELVV